VRCAKGVKVGKCLNGSITVIEVEKNGKGKVVSFGDTTHLVVDLVQVNADVLEDAEDGKSPTVGT